MRSQSETIWQCLLVFLLVVTTGFGVAAGLSTSQRHYELSNRLQVTPPKSCSSNDQHIDACSAALTGPYGKIAGVPVAVWGTSAHLAAMLLVLVLAVGLALAHDGVTRGAMIGLLTIAAIGLLGTVVYLAIILTKDIPCSLCKKMHITNALLFLFAAVTAWRVRDVLHGALRDGMGVAVLVGGVVAVWLSSAAAIRTGFEDRFGAIRTRATANATKVDQFRTIMDRCPRNECLSPLVVPSAATPDETQSLVLGGDATEPALVALMNLTCVHCQNEYRDGMKARLTRLMSRTDVGLRIVLLPKPNVCAGNSEESVSASCRANTAALCALREGSPEATMRYFDAEIEREPGAEDWTFERVHDKTREQWLRENISARAADCYHAEMIGGYGALASHVEAARALQRAQEERFPECAMPPDDGEGSDGPEPPWWCFIGTPSFAVSLPAEGGASDTAAELLETAAASATDARWKYVLDCLPADPSRTVETPFAGR